MNAITPIEAADEASPQIAGAVAQRATVESLVRHRNAALKLFSEAHTAIAAAAAALGAAHAEAALASPGENAFNFHQHERKAAFLKGLEVPDREPWLDTARKMVDTDLWSYVVRITDLERLMDKKAKDELRQQLQTDVPEATVDNICATLERFALDAGTIWKRGIAECFSSLDRRFRSHDGWRVGSRIILTRAFGEYGSWNWHRDEGARMLDVERVFRILDEGMRAPLGYGIVNAIDHARGHGGGPRQTTVDTEYFRVRIFKNGNAHLWFKRDDLVERVNQLLGEYYGAPIPEDRDPDEDTGLNDPKTTPARHYGFFPTPDAAAAEVMGLVSLSREIADEPMRILEPSAGIGNLARRCFEKPAVAERGHEWERERTDKWNASHRFDHQVDCIELQPHLADALKAEGIFANVYQANFLAISPETTGLYDRVVMNPPFDRERDIDHVMHALRFLKPGGTLVAVMSAGTEFRSTKKSKAFREHMRSLNAHFKELPAGSFASVGTYCNTIAVRVHQDGRRQSWEHRMRSFEEIE